MKRVRPRDQVNLFEWNVLTLTAVGLLYKHVKLERHVFWLEVCSMNWVKLGFRLQIKQNFEAAACDVEMKGDNRSEVTAQRYKVAWKVFLLFYVEKPSSELSKTALL